MTNTRWPETRLIERLKAAQNGGEVNAIFKEIRELKLARSFTYLQRTIRNVGELFGISATPFLKQTLDHIEQERSRHHRRINGWILSLLVDV